MSLQPGKFGHWWSNERRDFAARVLSVIIPIEFNVLLNPTHDDFSDVVWHDPVPFAFDERLVRRGDRVESRQ
jgi:hypothetical protein